MKATIAAVLLDPEARNENPGNSAGRLREPAQLFTGMVRALNGHTDGNDFAYWWGASMQEHVFRPPSVFNFYPGDFPLAQAGLVAPEFGIHNVATALGRLNYISYITYWSCSTADASVPNAIGTCVNLVPFEADAGDPTKLVDRISMLALGQQLPSAARAEVIKAVSAFTVYTGGPTYLAQRVKSAVYLIFGSPYYQVIR